MHVTMVKKRLASGEPCPKCIQAEELLKARGLWPRIDDVVWADENDPASPGMKLANQFGVSHAPFFIVRGEADAEVAVYESVLKLVKERFTETVQPADTRRPEDDIDAAAIRLATESPQRILTWGLERYGASLGIAFSGAEDVVLIHMAKETRLPFSIFCLDTGRLHPETYRFIDMVRKRYELEIALVSPDAPSLEAFVKKKGLFSFYEDGHQECCGVRKIAPLRRTLATLRAWATGQRRDQSPATRSSIAAVERDPTFSGTDGALLVKLNPLAAWTSAQTWQYIRDNEVPFNTLHERGFISIGCEPCTRATLPGEHERAGRWWWEESTKRECGLHIGNVNRPH
jgi:phosphoadenosine phosphosulfate reductase